jgi:S-adenosylmethionine uptake transporter
LKQIIMPGQAKIVATQPALPFLVAAVGIGLFTLMDAYMKGLSQDLGPYTAMFWRSLIGIGISGILFFGMRSGFPARAALKLHSQRALNSACMALLFFYGITNVPLAEGIALTFIAPLIALYLAALMLKEKIASTAIIASLIGFAGVTVIAFARMKAVPTTESSLALMALLGSAVLYALNIVLMRQQAQAAGPIEICFFQSVLVTALFALAAPWYLHVPNAEQFFRLSVSAVLAISSLMLLAWAYARAQAQHLVPIEYSAFLWATVFGYIYYGEVITPVVIVGTVLIIIACWTAMRSRA